MAVTHLTGDALAVVKTLEPDSIDLIATSPPFFNLRNYEVDGQWGRETSPRDFLQNLLDLANAGRDGPLTPHGSIAFELGDSFSGSGGSGGDYDRLGLRAGQPKFAGTAARTRADGNGVLIKGFGRPPRPRGGRARGWPRDKSLVGSPTLFAWSLAYGRNLLDPSIGAERVEWIVRLAAAGISAPSVDWLTSRMPLEPMFEPWLVRNVIVWARNNPAVGSLGDKVRPATSYITVACPSPKRWFDLDAVRTEAPRTDNKRSDSSSYHAPDQPENRTRATDENGDRINSNPNGAPPRDRWTDEYDGDLTWLVNTAGSPLAHYAMWPARLAERLVLSMCPAEVCRHCGEPRRRIAQTTNAVGHAVGRSGWSGGQADHARSGTAVGLATASSPGIPRHVERETLGWSDCGHDDFRPGRVLDPFSGTGTTLAVADMHGRDAIGIDLDGDNHGLYPDRYDEVKKALFDVKPPAPGQADLFSEMSS